MRIEYVSIKKSQWRPWFAWRPVKVNDSWVWLKKIYRRKSWTPLQHHPDVTDQYGTIFDVMKEPDDETIRFPGRFYELHR